MAIGVIHRSSTPLLMPGSGQGQRLRRDMVAGICLGPTYARFERKAFVRTFEGALEALMPYEAGHKNFDREFARLCEAGIFEWVPQAQVLQLNPPPLERVRAHIARMRQNHAEYWREAA